MRSKPILTYLLLAVISLLLITLDLTNRVSALKNFIRYLLFPSPQMAVRVVSETKKLGGNLSDVVRVFEENRGLRQKLEKLRYFETQYKYLQKENNLLRAMMKMSSAPESKMIPASVISRDPAGWFGTMVIDKGAAEGIKPDMPVVGVSEKGIGLVGRTIETGNGFSKVMLLTDSLSYVPVKILRNGESCIASGRNTTELLLEYLSPGCDVRLGDNVVTSGIGEVFPGGIPLGTITGSVVRGKTYFYQAALKPEVNPGRIEKVLIIAK